jgi:iron-sulfur cluster assembly protein
MAQLLEVTDTAKERIRALISSRGKPTLGIRVGIKTRGCSGLAYKIEFADTPVQGDEKITLDDLNLFIDSKSILFMIGSVMDYVDDKVQSGFVFTNPNQKGSCGCGESFYV